MISQQIRTTDLISPAAASPHLLILLVSADLGSLPAIIERVSQEVSRHLFHVDGYTGALTLSIGGACFPTTASTRQALLSQAASLAAEAREDRTGRHRYRLASGPTG